MSLVLKNTGWGGGGGSFRCEWLELYELFAWGPLSFGRKFLSIFEKLDFKNSTFAFEQINVD